MGRDKALLPFRGASLVETVARAVREAAGSVVLVGRDPVGGDPAIPDLYPAEGPLGGILTALHHTGADWNLVVACDMPKLTGPFLDRLFHAAAAADADALIPRGPSGMPEPLCAVYHRRALQPLEEAFQAGQRKIAKALEGLRASAYPVAEVAWFQNVNTPEDWIGHAAD
jgi:molybdopterin-guanine dinucleotide biosynthesis protein A